MDIFREWSTIVSNAWAAFGRPLVVADPMPEEQQTHREQRIAELLALETDSLEAIERRQRIILLTNSVREAETHAAKLREELAIEHGQQQAHSFAVDTQANKIRAELAASCPAALDNFLDRVNTEIERCRKIHLPESMSHQLAELRQRLAELCHIREEANALRIAPLPIADILTKLRHLEHTSGLVAAH